MAGSTLSPNERTGLLANQEDEPQMQQDEHTATIIIPSDSVTKGDTSISAFRILPLALFAALAMAATAATTIFTYASLLCKNPTHCQASERNRYAGAVAVATSSANIGGLLVLGTLERLSKRNHKAGLMLWFSLRSMSVMMLAVGYQVGSILVALSGQLFEGLAPDNLLHFNLNAIYVQTSDEKSVSRLIGTSLALYMVGISVSPFVAGLLDDVSNTFTLAIGLFAASFLYLFLVVDRPKAESVSKISIHTGRPIQESRRQTAASSFRSFMVNIFSPLQSLHTRPLALIPMISLLLYNTGQAFIFSAIMVHTSLSFGFSAKQNGLLISIAHATSAIYLFFALFAAPRIASIIGMRNARRHTARSPARHPQIADALFAMLSLAMQSIFLTVLGLATESWQMYPITCLFSLGLATPSFIKSHTVLYFRVDDAPRAIAALSMMETIGGFLAPVVLGGVQTARPGAGVLFVASTIMGVAAVVFGIGAVVERARRSRYEPGEGLRDE